MSRSVGGNYTLAVGNPVSPNTTISTTWANSTLNDIASALTDSLSRSGLGGMQAPLKLPDGISGAPSLTFSAEETTGLYRADDGIVGLSVLGTVFITAGDGELLSPQPLHGQKGLTITNSTTNGAGTTSTGNGTAAGGVFTGGSSAGRGLTVTGGAGNGVGAVITGGSTGQGATISAGGGNNVGLSVTGMGSGTGANITGGTTGWGVNATGALGIVATGTNGVGATGIGSTGNAGGKFIAGTAASASVPQTALFSEAGYLTFTGASAGAAVTPNSDVGFTNTLGPNSFAKAHCVVDISTGTPTVQGKGKNIASVSIVTNVGLGNGVLRVTFTTAMASVWYTAIPAVMSASIPGKHANVVNATTGYCDIAVFTSGTGGTVVDLTSGSAVVSIIVMGEQ